MRPPFRLDSRAFDDRQMRARRVVGRFRLDCTAILAAAEKRKRRRARLSKLGAVMVLLLGGWAAAYIGGAPWLDAVIYAVVVTVFFAAVLSLADRRVR
jgi:hypothetical protein